MAPRRRRQACSSSMAKPFANGGCCAHASGPAGMSACAHSHHTRPTTPPLRRLPTTRCATVECAQAQQPRRGSSWSQRCWWGQVVGKGVCACVRVRAPVQCLCTCWAAPCAHAAVTAQPAVVPQSIPRACGCDVRRGGLCALNCHHLHAVMQPATCAWWRVRRRRPTCTT
jgi:hypothetical protein